LNVAEYEACERALLAATCAPDFTPPADLVPGLYEEQYAGGTREYFREYTWS
jgi:hypothetical protein